MHRTKQDELQNKAGNEEQDVKEGDEEQDEDEDKQKRFRATLNYAGLLLPFPLLLLLF